MNLTNLKIKDLITPKAKLTFLAGAGCSIDPPSCLPAGKAMMDAIIEYICPEADIQKIKELKQLRFEALIEVVQNNLDYNLEIIDFYGLCDKPNIQHFFLANMIKKGNFVMTTNFDFLIEHALRLSEVQDESIIPVITKEDFEKCKAPSELYKMGKMAVYKIHGSTRNLITNEDTRKYLVATIHAFGSNKEGLNVFQVEPFKREIFNNITKECHLIIIGYSGSDDFDIVPTLKILKNLKSVIWINYTHDLKMGNEEIYEIDKDTDKMLDTLSNEIKKVTQILFDIKQMNTAEHIYRVDVNTSDFAARFLQEQPKLDQTDFSIDVNEWIKNKIKKPDKFVQNFIASSLYLSFNEYYEALRCANEALKLNESEREYLYILNYIGMIYYEQRDFPNALKRFEEIIAFRKKTGEMYGGDSILYYNMGTIYYKLRNYTKALNLIGESLQLERRLLDKRPSYHRRCFFGLGLIYKDIGNFSEALKWLDRALKFDEEIGDLSAKSKCLNKIGEILIEQKKYSEALERFDLALKIADNLGDLAEKAISLKNIGYLYQNQENYEDALKNLDLALRINEQNGYLANKATVLQNIGDIYLLQENHSLTLGKYEEALKIFEQLNDLISVVTLQKKIGDIFQIQGNLNNTVLNYKKALPLIDKISDMTENSTFDDDFSAVHRNLAQMGWKVEEFVKVQRRDDIIIKNQILNNLTKIYQQLENVALKSQFVELLNEYPTILDCINKGVQNTNLEFGKSSGLAFCYIYSGSDYKKKGRYKEALYCYEESMQIFRKMETTGIGISSDNMIMKFDALMDTIDINIKISMYQDAIQLLEEAFIISNILEDNNMKFKCSTKIAQIFFNVGQYDKALQYYQNSSIIAGQLNDKNKQFNTLIEIVNLFNKQSNSNEALKYSNMALEIANELDDSSRKFICLNNLGNLQLRLKNDSAALEKFMEAHEIAKNLDDKKKLLSVTTNIALFQSSKENYKEAIKYFEEALNLAENEKDFYTKALSLIGLAEINFKKENYLEALKQYAMAFPITDQLGEDELELECILGLTDIHMIVKNYTDAKKTLEIGFQIIYKQMGMYSEIPKDIESPQGIMNNYIQEIDKRWKKVNELLKNQNE